MAADIFYWIAIVSLPLLLLGWLAVTLYERRQQKRYIELRDPAECKVYWREALARKTSGILFVSLYFLYFTFATDLARLASTIGLPAEDKFGMALVIGLWFICVGQQTLTISRQLKLGWDKAQTTSFGKKIIMQNSPHKPTLEGERFGPNGAVNRS